MKNIFCWTYNNSPRLTISSLRDFGVFWVCRVYKYFVPKGTDKQIRREQKQSPEAGVSVSSFVIIYVLAEIRYAL